MATTAEPQGVAAASPAPCSVFPADLNVVLGAVVGSTAYGLAHADSDQDRLGVFVAPTDEVLGLSGPVAVTRTVTGNDPDFACHEVGKFLSLCMNANPTVMELLWLPAYEVCSEAGELLVGVRSAVLSDTKVRGAYGGYATQQAQRLLRRHEAGKEGFSSDLAKRTAKHGRHCYRLLLSGLELLTTGELTVDVSARRDEVFAAGELAVSDPVGFAAWFEAERERFDAVESVLPAEPDAQLVSDTLVQIRRLAG